MRTQAEHLADYLGARLDQGEDFLADLAYTLGERRSLLPWRAVASASSIDGLKIALNSDDMQINRVLKEPNLGFIFTGESIRDSFPSRRALFGW